MYTVYPLNSGKRLLTDNSGEAPEESHISANVRKKTKSFLCMPIGIRRNCLTKREVKHLKTLSLK
jgi:hypothetical protein